MTAPTKRVVFDYEHGVRPEGADMEFRLTYEGPLLAETANRKLIPARATQKHDIRKRFHSQLKRAWEVMPQLNGSPYRGARTILAVQSEILPHTREALAERFARGAFNFVPMATRDMELLCALDILFLRNDPPGQVYHAGDIDNRVKTLLDALRLPSDLGELGSHTAPDEDERPFFVLLEDDSLITKLSVETDTLLEPIGEADDPSDARVIITVKIWPYMVYPENRAFS